MGQKIAHYKSIDPEVLALAKEHDFNKETVVEILKEIDIQKDRLNPETIQETARALRIPASQVYGVATFYSMLTVRRQKEEGILSHGKQRIRLCDGPVCQLAGAEKIRELLAEKISEDSHFELSRNSCLGLCDRAPAGLVNSSQVGPIAPDNLDAVLAGWQGQALRYIDPHPAEVRVMMARAGKINPDLISSALDFGAYCGLHKALDKSPGEILDEIESSGLTGRGGAGFLVGRKWRFVANATKSPKYIICNADESEPLIFKDRILIDTDPHQILEGMAIAGYATGSEEGIIYIRGEYEPQAARLERAIAQATEAGWLGKHIQGGHYSFHISVHRGAGAYICGEETALIESLEGKRGEPRLRPPYPPTYGLYGLPTLVNNVESFAAVPAILCNGSDWYRGISDANTPGTKMYMVLGHVNRPGVFEAPFGLTLRQIIDEFGGGMKMGSHFQFALTGGAAGTIVSPDQLDIPIDYSSGVKGISLGAGAFLICDQSVSLPTFLRDLLFFFKVESCGKCTPCRIGTHQAYTILEEYSSTSNASGVKKRLFELADILQSASFCGLGQSVAMPIKSALNNFPNSFPG